MWEPTDELVDTLATRLRVPADRVRALLAGRDDRPEGIATLELWANRLER